MISFDWAVHSSVSHKTSERLSNAQQATDNLQSHGPFTASTVMSRMMENKIIVNVMNIDS